jgi:hypothetical protein
MGSPAWVSNIAIVALLLCAAALLALLLGPGLRPMVRKHWVASLLIWSIGLFVGAPALVYMWERSAPVKPPGAGFPYRVTETALKVDGLAVPPGTLLRLARDGDTASAYELNFDPPLQIQGVRTASASRAVGPASRLWRLTAAGENPKLSGWTCAVAAPVAVDAPLGGDAGSRHGLRGCALAAGNQAGGVAWPAGTQLYRKDCASDCTPEQQTAGAVLWQLSAPASMREWLGFPVQGLVVTVDEQRKLTDFRAYLSAQVRLGEFRYQPFTRVTLRGDDLAFHPDTGAPARRDDGSLVNDSESVIQSRDGQVLGIAPTYDPIDLRMRHFLY